jgi:hypothetical protein
MRNFPIVMSALVATIFASTAQAERWIDMGTNKAIRPELQAGFSFCVDADSVKTDKEGWTSYKWKLCSDKNTIFEGAVQCAQDFSVDQVPIRGKTLIDNGKPKPNEPWKTTMTYVSSMSGKFAKWVCHK